MDIWLTVVTAVGVYVAVIALSRFFGQRQFAQLTAYDLPFVFALGSLVGRVILVRTTLVGALAGITTMFVLHAGTGRLHHWVPAIHRFTENKPIMLVAGGTVLEGNLRRARTSMLELHEKLRIAGLASLDDVAVAVMERTGEISLVRTGGRIDAAIYDDVVGREHLQ